VTLAAHSGQLQLNAYEPLCGLAIIESQALIYNTSIAFRTNCIDGITINERVLAHYLETTVGIVTAPEIPFSATRRRPNLQAKRIRAARDYRDHPGEEDSHRTTDSISSIRSSSRTSIRNSMKKKGSSD